MRLFGFPNECEEGYEPHKQRQPHIQAEVGGGQGVNCHSISRVGRRGAQVLRQMDLEGRAPWWLSDNAREEAISHEAFFPKEGKRRCPHSLLSLTETKTRMDIRVKRSYKKLFKMDFRMGGGY